MQAHFNLLNHKVNTMAKSERPTTGKYANYEHVADRVDGVHRVNEDRVEIKTSKPTFETHELLGSLIVCEATVTIYPTDPLLPDKVEYIQQAHKTIAKPDGKSGFKSLEMNSDSMYETVQTKAIGRALAAAGYLGRKGSEKMSFAAAEDIQDAKEATSSTTTKEPSPTLQVVEDEARKELNRRQDLSDKLEKKVGEAKAELTNAITIPGNGTELTPQLWKSWLDAAKIPEDTFKAIDGSQQKASVPKLAQIFQAYQSKKIMKPEVLKAQLESQYQVVNPRLLTDEQADKLIGEMKAVK